MITEVHSSNILQAAAVHSISWQESHRSFCAPEFIAMHTPERQRGYLEEKMRAGSAVYLLVEDEPVGIVSVWGNLIEDLYVLPEMQNKGYGSELLRFAVGKCVGIPTLWILENNLKMKKRLSIVAIILMMDNILAPFSFAIGNEADIFDVEENVVVENEDTQENFSEDVSDLEL